jgi:thiosulfate/3-mercaptopyruvate sulfurtransferase
MDKQLHDWLVAEGFGGELHTTIANRMTPLMCAAAKGDEEMARKIVAAGGDVLAVNGDGNQALWLACVPSHLGLIDLLLEAGLDKNHCNDNGATPMMFAASSGRTEVVAHLLKHGADYGIETQDGFSALDMAANAVILGLLRAAQKARAATAG